MDRDGQCPVVDVEVAVDVAVHAEVLLGHGRGTRPRGGRRGRGRSGRRGCPRPAGSGATAVKTAGAGVAQDRGVVAEVGGHDRPARGEVDGDLALDRVVLAAGQAGVDQDVGAAGQRDDLLGGLAGQDDQPIADRAELRRGSARPPRRGRPRARNAPRARRAKTRGKASIRIGTPWFGWTMLPTYMTTLCSGPTPGSPPAPPGRSYSREVDPRVDDRDPLGRHSLLLDHDPLDRLAQDDDLRRVPARPGARRSCRSG